MLYIYIYIHIGFGGWALGFEVWGLGFRIWGLEFTVWGLGFGVISGYWKRKWKLRLCNGVYIGVIVANMGIYCMGII